MEREEYHLAVSRAKLSEGDMVMPNDELVALDTIRYAAHACLQEAQSVCNNVAASTCGMHLSVKPKVIAEDVEVTFRCRGEQTGAECPMPNLTSFALDRLAIAIRKFHDADG